MNGWEPIESAPKNGARIDLWAVHAETGDGYRVSDCWWHKAQEIWKTYNHNGAGYNLLKNKTPTYWRKCPGPPVDTPEMYSYVRVRREYLETPSEDSK